ncbi:MAG TPA: class I SAM-dependent methyltransferase [Dehalococcoidia bacterium]|nr:class I SAM-dependent methyltransferase [Dehalococcoidia bacterium]
MTKTRKDGGHRCFAALHDRFSAPMERRVLIPLRQRFGDLRGEVLEIGVGTGANLPHYSPSAHVTGIEPDPFMLKRARERLAQLHAANIDLRLASAELLPFPDQSFDPVVSTLVLCTVPNPSRALAEIRRVLKPNGTFDFIEHVRGEGRLGRFQVLIRPLWERLGAGCQLNCRTGESIEAAGFSVKQIEVKRIQLGIPLLVGTAEPITPSSSPR